MIGMIEGFIGFKIFNSNFQFWVVKFGKNFFLCGLIYVGIFSGVQNNLKICGSAPGVVPIYLGRIVL